MTRRKYSEEYKQEAAKLVVEGGVPQTQAARDLGLAQSTLEKWVHNYQKSGGKEGLSLSEREELKALRKENTRLRMEREILKKATAFFAKDSTKTSDS
jgi:transposase